MKSQNSMKTNVYRLMCRSFRGFGHASLLWAGVLSVGANTAASPLENSFCYQGQLMENGVPANGSFDLRFALYEVEFGGIPVVAPVTNASVAVINGLFTTTIDFGVDIFSGNTHWMEMAARPIGETEFSTSGRRQPIPTEPTDSSSSMAADETSHTAHNETQLRLLGVNSPVELHALDLGSLAPAPVSCTTYS